MINPQHHPNSGWIMDYACGHLAPAFKMVIESHLLGCAHCREDLRTAENLGAEFMMACPEDRPRLTATDILDSTASAPNFRTPRLQLPDALDLKGLVSSYLRVSLDALRWRSVGGGIAISKLRDEQTDRLWLLRAKPGALLPQHTHRGSELTLVLQGAYVIGDTIFGEGSLEDADEHTIHQPIVTTIGECFCLAATSGPLIFDGWFAKLAQRYLQI